MARVRDFVGDYENIRALLRDIFLYGCFTVDDFGQRGISPSKYNQEKRKLLAFIDGKYISSRRINGKTAMFFTNDMFDVAYNFLFDTYMMKSFVESDVRISLKILQLLAKHSSGLTVEKLIDYLESNGGSIESLTVYRSLIELKDQGYVTAGRTRKPYIYRLAKDIFEDFSNDEILQLMHAVNLMRNVNYPSICGNFLFDTLNRYRKASRTSVRYRNLFLFKHSHFAQVLDEDIMWRLLLALNDSCSVSFDYQGENRSGLYPVKLIVDEYYGRRYLFSVSIIDGSMEPHIFRLDKISNLRIGSKVSVSSSQLDEIYQKNLRNSFNGVCLPKDGKTCTVALAVKKEVFPLIKDHLYNGEVKSEDSDFCHIELVCNDPRELKPWLRRFTGKIFVQKSNEHNLFEEMELELAEWRTLYENIH